MRNKTCATITCARRVFGKRDKKFGDANIGRLGRIPAGPVWAEPGIPAIYRSLPAGDSTAGRPPVVIYAKTNVYFHVEKEDWWLGGATAVNRHSAK